MVGTDRGQRQEAGAAAVRPARPRPTPARDRVTEAPGRPISRDSSSGRSRRWTPAGADRAGRASRGASRSTQAKTERILENLLSNSIRHTPEEAKIWVRARPHDGGVLFVVEDDGPGRPVRAPGGGLRAVPAGAGVVVGARPGRRHRPVARAALRRAARGERLGRGARRRRRVVPRVLARVLNAAGAPQPTRRSREPAVGFEPTT